MDHQFQKKRRIHPYGFVEVNAVKIHSRTAGQDIIDFGLRNPDQLLAPRMIEQAREATLESIVHSIPILSVLLGYVKRNRLMIKDNLELLLPCVLTLVNKAMDRFTLNLLKVFLEPAKQYEILKYFFAQKHQMYYWRQNYE